MTNRNIFWGKGGRCLGVTTLVPTRADFLEILVDLTPWKFKVMYSVS
jgi:hypothetical protein